MNPGRNYLGVFSVIGLVAVLGISRGIDALFACLGSRIVASPTLSMFYRLWWAYTLAYLLLAILVLLLFQFALNKASKNVWVAMTYLLIGLYILVTPQLSAAPAFDWLIPKFIIWFTNVQLQSFFNITGGFVAAAGLLMLILPRPARITEQ